MKSVSLFGMPYEVMLLIEHGSGVIYKNQVGGNVCWQAEIEGVLAPLDLERPEADRIIDFPYQSGGQGITSDAADEIQAVLDASPEGRCIRVDRARLDDCFEAWVHVLVESTARGEFDAPPDYSGSTYGFGTVRGVLTWPNSD